MARGQTQHEVEIRWLPFFLRPHMPPEGVLKQGKGAENVNPRLRAAGEAVGINFTGACDRAPNSTEAHALLAYAAKVSPDKQNALQEVLFRHYFTDGLYPAGANLAAAATEAGLDGAAAQAFAEDPTNKAEVAEEARRNAMRGVSGTCYHSNLSPTATNPDPDPNPDPNPNPIPNPNPNPNPNP